MTDDSKRVNIKESAQPKAPAQQSGTGGEFSAQPKAPQRMEKSLQPLPGRPQTNHGGIGASTQPKPH
jgi:hypothetical protein